MYILLQVYDRFQTLGITLSYQTSVDLLDVLGGEFGSTVIDGIKQKKTIRIIADNVNFKININDQHFSDDGHTYKMHNMFSSALLVKFYISVKKI